MTTALVPQSGVAAGVPFVAVPPATPSPSAPVVVAWHMMDPPRTEAAFAAALPLTALDAWRVYLGLPMSGSRLPAGGFEALMRLGYEDAVRNLHGPIVEQAAEEFPAAWSELRAALGLGDGPVGVLGASTGAAVAQLVLAEGRLRARAAVLVSPVVQLRAAVDAIARRFGVSYPWSEPSLAVAERVDFVARAAEIADHGEPAVLLVVGENDDEAGFREPAARLREALSSRYTHPGRVDMIVVPGMGHALAEEPGTEPAPQTPHAAAVDRYAACWLRRQLA
ncbi:MAG TPA: prolyl oligopeptidase family serine peptidase [Acidimicrobiales bacterium]|nr:prolyl oligopeptidase family serine peptidase [Acidimicrobiales bacterium]